MARGVSMIDTITHRLALAGAFCAFAATGGHAAVTFNKAVAFTLSATSVNGVASNDQRQAETIGGPPTGLFLISQSERNVTLEDGTFAHAGAFSSLQASFSSATQGLLQFQSRDANVQSNTPFGSYAYNAGWIEYLFSTDTNVSFTLSFGGSGQHSAMGDASAQPAFPQARLFDASRSYLYASSAGTQVIDIGPGAYTLRLEDAVPFYGYVDAGNGSASESNSYFASFSMTPVTSPVPEPTAWTMMIAGFGAIGAALRRRHLARGTWAVA